MSVRGGGSGSTPPEQMLAWQVDRFEVEDPFSSGFTLALTQTPVDADAIQGESAGAPLDTSDFNYLSGPNEIEILFSADPSTDAPDGIWVFLFRYPYEV